MKKEKLYACVEDLQGCDWAVGDIETIEGWRERAIEWADMDENEDLIKELQKCAKKNVIAFISNIWELKFEERKKAKEYKCIKDLRGTHWREGEINTIEGWREIAIRWAFDDGDDGTLEILEKMPEENVMDFISEYYDFKFKGVK